MNEKESGHSETILCNMSLNTPFVQDVQPAR